MSVDVYFVEAVVAIGGAAFGIWSWSTRRLTNNAKEFVTDILRDALDPIGERLSTLETKMDLFWRSVAIDAAKILHHPEPSRFRVDELLDKFMAERISPAESTELRGYLEIIRDWEPGSPSPFKVFQGEQVAAAILLHTMEHVVQTCEETSKT